MNSNSSYAGRENAILFTLKNRNDQSVVEMLVSGWKVGRLKNKECF